MPLAGIARCQACPAGAASAPSEPALASRGTSTSPPRTATRGSPVATAARSASQSPGSRSTSASTKRPGFSDCAERTSPAAAAPAGSPVPVTNSRRASANRSSASQDRTRSNARCVRSRTSHGSPVSVTTATSGTSSPSRSVTDSISRQVPGSLSDNAVGIQSSCNRESLRAVAARSWAGETGRITRDSTASTGRPVPSLAVSASSCGPVRVIRTRSVDAPVAYRVTPFQANGSSTCPGSPAMPVRAVACSAASSSAGCTP